MITYPGVAQMVACLNGVQEAAGSNPVTRTKKNPVTAMVTGFLYFPNFPFFAPRLEFVWNRNQNLFLGTIFQGYSPLNFGGHRE